MRREFFAIATAIVMILAVLWAPEPAVCELVPPGLSKPAGGGTPGVVGSLRVLTLNTALLTYPLFFGGKPCVKGRARLLGQMLRDGIGDEDYDVIMLQEVFDGFAALRILEELDGKYSFWYFQKPPSAGLEINGGSAILSKYPFQTVRYDPDPKDYFASAWQECDTSPGDCNAQKGWLHVRIDLNGIPVNFFSLHTQANYGVPYYPSNPNWNFTWTQQEQMKQLKAHVESFPDNSFEADLSQELMVLGGDYNVLAHCQGCKMSSDYMSVAGILGLREVWREQFCYSDSAGDDAWHTNGEGSTGATQPSPSQRLDMILYDDSRNSAYEIRPRNVAVNTFRIGFFPPVACDDDGDFSKMYPWEYVSDHWGVEATLDLYSAAAAPAENTQCGPIPGEAPTGNPFQFSRVRDEYLSCYGIAGGISSNCNDVWDFNDKQLCHAMSRSDEDYCQSMTIRDLQLACVGITSMNDTPCGVIVDPQMREFCRAVADEDGSRCIGLTNRDTQLLCYALAYGNSSNCRDISDPSDRQFCYAVSSLSTSYCSSIPAGEPDPPLPPPPPPPPPPSCANFDYSQCIPFQTCRSFCLIGDFSPIGHPCCGCTCNGFDECPLCLDPGFE